MSATDPLPSLCSPSSPQSPPTFEQLQASEPINSQSLSEERNFPPSRNEFHWPHLTELSQLFRTLSRKVFEMSTTEKWRLANWHKDSGVALFKDGKLEWAFRRFSLALKYIISLAHDVPASEHDDEVSSPRPRSPSLYEMVFDSICNAFRAKNDLENSRMLSSGAYGNLRIISRPSGTHDSWKHACYVDAIPGSYRVL